MEADGFVTYEFENFRLVHDLDTGISWFEWDITNNLNVPITIQPNIALYGCDVSRTGTEPNHLPLLYAGETGGCSACGQARNVSLTSAMPSVADGTHDSTLARMTFQGSTLNIQSNVTSNAANKTIIGNSVKNKYLRIHPEANKTKANATILRQHICTVDSTPIGIVNGTATTLQPGESVTVRSTVDSSDWGFSCSPVNRGLINYNVNAGSSSYKGLTVDQTIVFGDEESNICG